MNLACELHLLPDSSCSGTNLLFFCTLFSFFFVFCVQKLSLFLVLQEVECLFCLRIKQSKSHIELNLACEFHLLPDSCCLWNMSFFVFRLPKFTVGTFFFHFSILRFLFFFNYIFVTIFVFFLTVLCILEICQSHFGTFGLV